jgi:hypothetical protein
MWYSQKQAAAHSILQTCQQKYKGQQHDHQTDISGRYFEGSENMYA